MHMPFHSEGSEQIRNSSYSIWLVALMVPDFLFVKLLPDVDNYEGDRRWCGVFYAQRKPKWEDELSGLLELPAPTRYHTA